jgi:hypothetical protein
MEKEGKEGRGDVGGGLKWGFRKMGRVEGGEGRPREETVNRETRQASEYGEGRKGRKGRRRGEGRVGCE